jgi:hypothetical protein
MQLWRKNGKEEVKVREERRKSEMKTRERNTRKTTRPVYLLTMDYPTASVAGCQQLPPE